MESPATNPDLIDLEAAKRHLRLLDPDKDAKFVFQVFPDHSKASAFPANRRGTLDEQCEWLVDASRRGAGAFVTVSYCEGRGLRRDGSTYPDDAPANGWRVAETFKHGRAVFAEWDNGIPQNLPIQPSAIVWSSAGKAHGYFLTDDPLSRADLEGMVGRLVQDYGSDPKAADCTRVLRLAGFPHQKNPSARRTVTLDEPLLDENGEVRVYTRAELLAAFPPVAVTPTKASQKSKQAKAPKAVSNAKLANFDVAAATSGCCSLPSGADRNYVLGAVRRELERVGSTTEGGRNAALNVAAHSIGTLGRDRIDVEQVKTALTRAAECAGLEGREIAGTIKSGLTKGLKKRRETLGRDHALTGYTPMPGGSATYVKEQLKAMGRIETKEALIEALGLMQRDCGLALFHGKTRWAVITSAVHQTTIGTTKLATPYREVQLLERAAFLEWFSSHKVDLEAIDGGEGADGSQAKRRREAPSIAQLYAGSSGRTEFSGVAFLPGEAETPGVLNLWTGWPIPPIPGVCDKFLNHIRDNICSGDAAHFTFVLDWMAHIFQHPLEKPGSALVLRGGKGTGKTKLAEWLSFLLGPYALIAAKPGMLTGRFNGHTEKLMLLTADEGFWAGDPSATGSLNELITSSSVAYETKGVDARSGQNYCRAIIIGNEAWQVPATEGERRYMVLDVAPLQQQCGDYFAALDAEMFNGGAAALLDLLMRREITSDLRNPPKTRALMEQIAHGFNAAQQWLADTIESGEAKIGGRCYSLSQTEPVRVPKADLYDWIKTRSARPMTTIAIGKVFKALGCNTEQRMRGGCDGARAVELPMLVTLRATWAARYGQHFD